MTGRDLLPKLTSHPMMGKHQRGNNNHKAKPSQQHRSGQNGPSSGMGNSL